VPRTNRDDLRVESLSCRPLSVPLVDSFVIASGRVDATQSVEVVTHVRGNGAEATGYGEAACLRPVTRENQDDVLRAIERVGPGLLGRPLPATLGALEDVLGELMPGLPVARAGVEMSILDAMSRVARLPLRALLGGDLGARTRTLETDITIAIAEPDHMARLAVGWRAKGFRALKVKVGADFDTDMRVLEAIRDSAPDVRLRIDANAGLSPRQAIALARQCEALGLAVECWEQPCAAEDLDAMAEVAAAVEAPVIADESVKTDADLASIIERRCAGGVNLKLAKMGGLLPAYRMGMTAKSAGLKVMAGGMVETRLGMTAAAHLACALGGVDYVDLDTAWLLKDDPYEGGYSAAGPNYTLFDVPGLDVTRRTSVPSPGG
jgi:L-Ala-D/L-Glu epimerase / N-acetyl-D-glutamate racemase